MKKQVVILGAGIAGLSAGYFLQKTGKFDVTLIEKQDRVGGLCGSFEHEGFVLDYGAHKLYSTIPGVLDGIREVMGDRLAMVRKSHKIFLKGHALDYPLKLGNFFKALGLVDFLKMGFGYAAALFTGGFDRRPVRSYKDYMLRRFGRPTYEMVFDPLADKVWGDPSTLHVNMALTRFPASNGLDIVLKLLGIKKETKDSNAEFFYYPKEGFRGFGLRLKEMIEGSGGKIITGASVERLRRRGDSVEAVEGTCMTGKFDLPCDVLISTIPLQMLSRLVFEDKSAVHMADDLEFRHLIMVYLFIDKPLVLKDQWIFFPERKYLFSRIFEQKQILETLGPKNKTAICCDLTCPEESWAWKADDKALLDRCAQGLQDAGFVSEKKSIYSGKVLRVKNFYPRYGADYSQRITSMTAQLQKVNNLLLTGRLGMYNYNNSDHCFDMGRFIADGLAGGESAGKIWNDLAARVAEYRIVD